MTKVKGFTMIELLLVLQIILLMTYIEIPNLNQNIQQKEFILEEIKGVIEKTRLDAILRNAVNELEFKNHGIYVSNQLLYENQQLEFQNHTYVYFNEQGHIRKACTIYFDLKNQSYKLVFNLGQGAFYIEEI